MNTPRTRLLRLLRDTALRPGPTPNKWADGDGKWHTVDYRTVRVAVRDGAVICDSCGWLRTP